MKPFLSGRGPDLVRLDGGNIGGVVVEGEEFHFVGFAVFLDVDHRAHVASHQPVRRERRRQNHSIVLFDHIRLSHYAGYAVASRGEFRPRSTIRTVRTNGGLPDGVSIAAWRTCFTPVRSFQVLNHLAFQGCAAKGFGERFPIAQAEAERFKEFGFAVVVRMRGVE